MPLWPVVVPVLSLFLFFLFVREEVDFSLHRDFHVCDQPVLQVVELRAYCPLFLTRILARCCQGFMTQERLVRFSHLFSAHLFESQPRVNSSLRCVFCLPCSTWSFDFPGSLPLPLSLSPCTLRVRQ